MFWFNNVIVVLEILLNNILILLVLLIIKNMRRRVINIIMNLIRDKSIINSGFLLNCLKWNLERFF